MDHRPFENWLLENKTINAEERRRLNSHLQSCPSCTALAEVDLALTASRMSAPAAGFVSRFQLRLEARKKALRRRNAWGFFLLGVSVLVLITWLSWPVLSVALHSPTNLLGSWLASLVTLWAALQATFQAGSVFFKVIPNFIPAFLLPVLLIVGAGWGLMWVLSLMKLTKFSQGVQP
jgi:hypothetical protein